MEYTFFPNKNLFYKIIKRGNRSKIENRVVILFRHQPKNDVLRKKSIFEDEEKNSKARKKKIGLRLFIFCRFER